jgi:hypothetical protein
VLLDRHVLGDDVDTDHGRTLLLIGVWIIRQATLDRITASRVWPRDGGRRLAFAVCA